MCIMCLKMGDDPAFCDPLHPRVAAQGKSPPDPLAGLPAPAATPPSGVPTGGIILKHKGLQPPPITRTNSTGDPRIIWEDGQIAIIYAKDFPANQGMGRSRTRDDLTKAINATIEDALQTAPGAGSGNDFVKVWLKELLARPSAAMAPAKVLGRLPVSPRQFIPVKPTIATGGRYKGQIIPDFPHTCAACNGPCYQSMFDCIHDTPDGKCPNDRKPEEHRLRRR